MNSYGLAFHSCRTQSSTSARGVSQEIFRLANSQCHIKILYSTRHRLIVPSPILFRAIRVDFLRHERLPQ